MRPRATARRPTAALAACSLIACASGATEYTWTYSADTTLVAGNTTVRKMGDYQAPMMLTATTQFRQSAPCGRYRIELLAGCGVGGSQVRLPLLEGVCADCDAAGSCSCKSGITVGLDNCSGLVTFYVAHTNENTAAECDWTRHGVVLTYFCADGHFGSTCTRCDDCSGCGCHGTATASGDTCGCACHNKWTGAQCTTCPLPNSGPECDSCTTGYIKDAAGECVSCDPPPTPVSCPAPGVVVPNADKTECVCGARGCAAGQVMDLDPNGQLLACVDCTSATHCSGHASSVWVDEANNRCVCICRNHWEGVTCGSCAQGFGGDDCATCAEGFVMYPICMRCTNDAHCYGRSTAARGEFNTVLSNQDRTECLCGSCRNGWSGPACNTCPFNYIGADCDRCATDFANYPSCRRCTTQDDCSGHAASVVTTGGRCVCDCANRWEGAACADCPVNWAGADCDQCYGARTGADCEVCPPQYVNDGVNNCDKCVPMRVAFPACTECTDATTCSGHGTAGTDANQTVCTCACDNAWNGTDCGTCPDNFAGADCDRCATDYIQYPICRKCTSQDFCNGHTDAEPTANAAADTCVCVCNNHWTGAQCEICPPEYEQSACALCAEGYIGGSGPCTQCTSADHCSGRATSVTSDAARAACECTCRNFWLTMPFQPACGFCMQDYKSPVNPNPAEQDGDCDKCVSGKVQDTRDPSGRTCIPCDPFTHCSAHASAASYAGDNLCACDCLDQWTGPTCNECAAKFQVNAGRCAQCARGHVGYPTCTECSSAAHCSDHAAEVTDENYLKCKCTCRNGWEHNPQNADDQCSYCPPQYGGPDCDQCGATYIGEYGGVGCSPCTSATHCSGHAANVTANDAHDGCVCSCRNQWTGPTCGSCPARYTGDDCDRCPVGQIGYPNCEICTDATHCTSRGKPGTATSNANQTRCVCQCIDSWQGEACNVCPSQFEQTECKSCSPGHFDYPTCYPCGSATHCNNHAVSVATQIHGPAHWNCSCTCADQWTGLQCETCPPAFDASRGCSECAEGRINYPTCTQCASNPDCNDHASAVTSNAARDDCVCTCVPGWDGAKCESCPAQFDQGGACDKCAPGRVAFPDCRECTLAADCAARADSVAAAPDGSRCECACQNKWDAGSGCTSCPSPYAGAGCDQCQGGHVRYPDCVQCTVAGDCSGHATSVAPSAAQDACLCQCRNGWSGAFCEQCNSPHAGADCDACVAGFAGADCGSCADGYIGYPGCTKCELSACNSGRGLSVTSSADHSGCVCTCSHGWGGAHCETCPAQFAVGSSGQCDSCAAGHVGYPDCRRCLAANCAAPANAISSAPNANATDCVCTCLNKWDPASGCAECSSPFGGAACDQCKAGFHTYPSCEPCEIATHCSGHATAVTSADSVCQCSCSNKWSGATCAECLSPFGGADCAACATGHIGYPDCVECTSADHCSAHATAVAVSGDGAACECTCAGQYSGAQCASCAPGRINYPDCTACAPDSADCSGHADATVPNAAADACVCQCLAKWEGPRCETCPAQFDQATCDKCARGRVSFPSCTACSGAADCLSGNTMDVLASSDGSRCFCVCRPPWSGPRCDRCPSEYSGDSCDQCAEGFTGTYPECGACTSDSHCSGRAEGVSSTLVDGARVCSCACRNHWQSGPTTPGCTECPAQFTGADCDACAPGHIGANCDQCTPAVHCSGHALPGDVTDNGDRTSCKCNACTNQWTGEQCQTCPPQFDSAADCARCGEGRVGFPTCRKCTAAADCSDHAVSAQADAAAATCVCTCRNGWSGASCGLCAAPYSGTDCDECAEGHFWRKVGARFECVACTSAGFCGGLATEARVDADGAGCMCVCPASRTGADCSQCADGYFSDGADCVRCTVSAHCSGHARGVDTNAARDGCTCDCVNKWSGADCGTCPAPYAGATCQECQAGRVGYPDCYECSVAAHCSGHAAAVTGDAGAGACKCDCDPAWAGDAACSTCTPGHAGPTCGKCTNAEHFNGRCLNEFQMGASVDKSKCECGACKNQWEGASCDVCPSNFAGTDCNECADGYVSYPSCVMCTVGGHCTTGAERAEVATDGSGCSCVCRNHWSGLRCGICQRPYAGDDCDRCEAGSIPTAGGDCEQCTNSQHCSGHAASVAPNADLSACVCTCRNKWGGAGCAACPMPFGGDDCDKCAPGHIGYPTCTECTINDHCSQRAASVRTDPQQTMCLCDCISVWEPEASTPAQQGCSVCPSRFQETATGCDRCGPGRAGFPACNECDLSQHCHGHAIAVSPSAAGDRCECHCSARWAPPTCAECPLPFGGTDCTGCATGYVAQGSPALTCTMCTVAEHCSGHARSVTTDANQNACLCNCLNAWEGATCDQCPPRAAGADCDRCAPGRVGFPSCTQCTTAACHEHAVGVEADAEQKECVCTCRNKWTGPTCADCAAEYGGANCDACGPGRINYPTCTPCHSGDLCGGRGQADANAAQDACECQCNAGYTGPVCGDCAQGYVAAGGGCERNPDLWCVGPLPAIEHSDGSAHCVPTLRGTGCPPGCKEGYTPEGEFRCGPDGQYDAAALPRCAPKPCADWPPAVPNSKSLRCSVPTQSGQGCDVECADGYQQTQPYLCVNGQFEQSAVCEPAACSAAPAGPVGDCAVPAAHGATCPLACPAGHTPSGVPKCDHGSWSAAECVPDACTTPPPAAPNSARSAAAAACPQRPAAAAAPGADPVRRCPVGSYGVSGAGADGWDGCYLATAQVAGGATVYAKDADHQLYKKDGTWRLGAPGAAVAYSHADAGLSDPPRDGYVPSGGAAPSPTVTRWGATVHCPAGTYAVSGAGAADWDGCYSVQGSRTTSDGVPLYTLDSTHHLYRWGGKWRLANYGISVAYLHGGSGQSLPPTDGYAAGSSGLGAAPTVALSAGSNCAGGTVAGEGGACVPCGGDAQPLCPPGDGQAAAPNGGCADGTAPTFAATCATCGGPGQPRCRAGSATGDSLRDNYGCRPEAAATSSGWCRACGGIGQLRCSTGPNGGCVATDSSSWAVAQDGKCAACGGHNQPQCLCATPAAGSAASAAAADLLVRNGGCWAGHAPRASGGGLCYRCGGPGEPQCFAASTAPRCDVPVPSGGSCKLMCKTRPIPARCSPTHEEDLSDNHVTLDASLDDVTDHSGTRLYDPTGPICFEWVPQAASRDEAAAVCRSRGGHLASMPSHKIETWLHNLALKPEWWFGLSVAKTPAGLVGSFDSGDNALWWNRHYNDQKLTKGECCMNMRDKDPVQLEGKCMRYNQNNIPDCPYQASHCDLRLPFWCMYWDDARVGAVEAYDPSGDYQCNAGQWDSPQCVPKKCAEAPPTVLGGTVDACPVPADDGAACVVTCADGFDKEADHVCSLGSWVPGRCKPKPCSDYPPVVPNGRPHPDCQPPFLHGALCVVQCDAGYFVEEPYVCRSGEWHGPAQCSPRACLTAPPPMAGGAALWVPLPAADGTVAPIMCTSGTESAGALQCKQGSWQLCTGPAACAPAAGAAACVPARCPQAAPLIPNAAAPSAPCLAGAANGVECPVICDAGHSPVGNNGMLSCSRGEWVAAECKPLPCAAIPPVENAAYTCRNVLQSGESCPLRCAQGYAAVGPAQWQCRLGNVTVGSCRARDCTTQPPMPQGGVASCSLPAAHGAKCSAKAGCRKGREPTGDFECVLGVWRVPGCSMARCNGPPPPTDGIAPAGADCTGAAHGGECAASCVAPNTPGPAAPWRCNDGSWAAPKCAASGEVSVSVDCCAGHVPRGAKLRCELSALFPHDGAAPDPEQLAAAVTADHASHPLGPYRVLSGALSATTSPGGSGGTALQPNQIVVVRETAGGGGATYGRIAHPAGWVKLSDASGDWCRPEMPPPARRLGAASAAAASGRGMLRVPYELSFPTEGQHHVRFAFRGAEATAAVTAFALTVSADAPAAGVSRHWTDANGEHVAVACDPGTWQAERAYSGAPLSAAAAPSAAACCAACREDAACMSWSYTAADAQCTLRGAGSALVDAAGAVSGLSAGAPLGSPLSGPPALYGKGVFFRPAPGGHELAGFGNGSVGGAVHWSVPLTASRTWGTVTLRPRPVPPIPDESVTYTWQSPGGAPAAGETRSGRHYVDLTSGGGAQWLVATARYPSSGECWVSSSAALLSVQMPDTSGSVSLAGCTSLHAGEASSARGSWRSAAAAPVFTYSLPEEGNAEVLLAPAAPSTTGWVAAPAVLPLPGVSCVERAPQGCTAVSCGEDFSGWCPLPAAPAAPSAPAAPAPGACCEAATAECNACKEGLSVADYCAAHPGRSECADERDLQLCCTAPTPECGACQAAQTVAQYCAENPAASGCSGGPPDCPYQGEGDCAWPSCGACEGDAACADGEYQVIGAGSAEWDGCYKPTGATVNGAPRFDKDATHHLYRYTNVWRLAEYGVRTYYEHAESGQHRPPSTGYRRTAGSDPPPAVHAGGAQYAAMQRCTAATGCAWAGGKCASAGEAPQYTEAERQGALDCAGCRPGICLCPTQAGCENQGSRCAWSGGACWPAAHCARWATVSASARGALGGSVYARLPVAVSPPTAAEAASRSADINAKINLGTGAFTRGDITACAVLQAHHPAHAGPCVAAATPLLAMLAALDNVQSQEEAADRVRRLHEAVGLGVAAAQGADGDAACCAMCDSVPQVIDDITTPAAAGCPEGDYEVAGAGRVEANGCYTPSGETVDGAPRWNKDATHHIYRWTNVWRVANKGVETYYVHSGSGQDLPPEAGYGAGDAGPLPAPTVRYSHGGKPPALQPSTTQRAADAMLAVLNQCTCGAGCATRGGAGASARRSAKALQATFSSTLTAQSGGADYVSRMHDVLARSVSQQPPGTPAASKSYEAAGGDLVAHAASDVHGSFRGGREVTAGGGVLRFHSEDLPFGSPEATRAFVVSAVSAASSMLAAELPAADHAGERVYSFAVWDADTGAKAELGTVEVTLAVIPSEGEAALGPAPLRALSGGAWVLPGGCADSGAYSVRCKVRDTPHLWALRHHAPRAPTPAPTPVPPTPEPTRERPQGTYAPPAPPATPHPPVAMLTPQPPGTVRAPEPTPLPTGMLSTEGGGSDNSTLVLVMVIVCVLLTAALCVLGIMHWRRSTLKKVSLEGTMGRSSKLDQVKHRVAGTGMGYGDLQPSPADTSTAGSAGDSGRERGSSSVQPTGYAHT